MKITFDSAVVAKRISNATTTAKTKTVNGITAFRAPVNPEAVKASKVSTAEIIDIVCETRRTGS